jgi:formylglycine-generating enzyme required for sulfatase activity/prolipoprotein diacylglyceryltransferase
MHPQLIALELAGHPLIIGSYGSLLCVALALAAASLLRAALAGGYELGAAISAAGTAVGAGLLGAVLVHGVVVWIDGGELAVALQHPGLSLFGALLGGGVGFALCARALGLPGLALLDRALPGLALAQAVARLGCLLGGCCFGREWHGPLALHYGLLHGVPRHPLPLYEAGAVLLLALGFARWTSATAVPAGRRSAAYVAAYACVRIALDVLRDPAAGGAAPGCLLSAGQALASWVLVAAAAWLGAGALSCSVIAPALRGGASLRRALDAVQSAAMAVYRSHAPARRWLAAACVLAACAAAWSVAAQSSRALVQGSDDAPLIRAGAFEMGSDADDVQFAVNLCRAYTDDVDACQPEVFTDEQPRHHVWVGAYRIDRTEVSRRAYLRCVQNGVCMPPRVADLDARVALPEHPVTGVTWSDAQRYCEWLGGRLPSEAEWERAARGSSARRFPWGSSWNARVANHGVAGPGGEQPDGFLHAAPVDAFPDGKSPYGMLNMAGNVWEMTADRYDHEYYARSERVAPRGPATGNERVIRGGSWRSVPHLLRVTQRAALAENEARPDVGFRCAY